MEYVHVSASRPARWRHFDIDKTPEALKLRFLTALWRSACIGPSTAAAKTKKTTPPPRLPFRSLRTQEDRRLRAFQILTHWTRDTANVAVFGARDGEPRSLASVHAGAVLRFIGYDYARKFPVATSFCGAAVTRDGATLIVADNETHALHRYSTVDGALLDVVDGGDDSNVGRLRFCQPAQVYIASDDFVFVADYANDCIQILTPQLTLHSVIGDQDDDTCNPCGVCANGHLIVVALKGSGLLRVFSRVNGALLWRVAFLSGHAFTCGGLDEMKRAHTGHVGGVCFTPWPPYEGDAYNNSRVAIANNSENRVTVVDAITGHIVRHIGEGILNRPWSVASTTFGELVVADTMNHRIVVFSAFGAVRHVLGQMQRFASVAVHDDLHATVVYALTSKLDKAPAQACVQHEDCVVFELE
jgi:hypothetical protein